MNSLDKLIDKIKAERGRADQVPGFDPQNGNEDARILFVLEAPGRKAVETEMISFDNPDQTAKNFREQLMQSGIDRSEICIWNIVPWYLGDGKKIRAADVGDVKKGLSYLGDLIAILKKLEFVVLVGGPARRAHAYLSHKTNLRILGCHHPSPKVVNSYPEMREENILIFRTMKSDQPAGPQRRAKGGA